MGLLDGTLGKATQNVDFYQNIISNIKTRQKNLDTFRMSISHKTGDFKITPLSKLPQDEIDEDIIDIDIILPHIGLSKDEKEVVLGGGNVRVIEHIEFLGQGDSNTERIVGGLPTENVSAKYKGFLPLHKSLFEYLDEETGTFLSVFPPDDKFSKVYILSDYEGDVDNIVHWIKLEFERGLKRWMSEDNIDISIIKQEKLPYIKLRVHGKFPNPKTIIDVNALVDRIESCEGEDLRLRYKLESWTLAYVEFPNVTTNHGAVKMDIRDLGNCIYVHCKAFDKTIDEYCISEKEFKNAMRKVGNAIESMFYTRPVPRELIDKLQYIGDAPVFEKVE